MKYEWKRLDYPHIVNTKTEKIFDQKRVNNWLDKSIPSPVSSAWQGDVLPSGGRMLARFPPYSHKQWQAHCWTIA